MDDRDDGVDGALYPGNGDRRSPQRGQSRPNGSGERAAFDDDGLRPGEGGLRIVRIFDASEGTPLDPLKNKTWDLNSPKTVPVLRPEDEQPAPAARKPKPQTAQAPPAPAPKAAAKPAPAPAKPKAKPAPKPAEADEE
jgi:hypothetical protein